MANGDVAAAAGMDVVPAVADKRLGYDEINKTRDYIAQKATATLPWTAITGKPSAFPPESHGHDSGQISHYGNPLPQSLDALYDGQLSPSLYNRILTGNRVGTWTAQNGVLGTSPSTRATKQNIRPADLTIEQLRAIPVVLYRYRREVALERKDPTYRAATEIGTLADDLHELGLWQFVVYRDRGDEAKPAGVHYELLALAAISLAQHAFDQLDTISDRLDKLEGNS